MRTMRLCTLGLLSAVIFAGCASDVANRYYAAEKYPPKAESEVTVLSETPTRPHVVIADFQSRGEDSEDMRRKAAAIGADAVIVTHLGGTYGDSETWSTETNGWTKRRYSRIAGTAIIYKD